MIFTILADLVVAVHFAFILFVVFGGFLLLWSKRIAWVHIPAVIWGGLIEFFGWVCPLTPLENFLRYKAGTAVYSSGFIEHYILPLLYPIELTRSLQYILGGGVFAVNFLIYGWIIYLKRK